MAGNKGENTVNEKMTTIANAIRSKTGKTEPLNLDDMANSVNEVYEQGKEEQRKISGVNEVYEQGKQAQKKKWWESYLAHNSNWYYMFGSPGWNDETFDPPVDIIPRGIATNLFYTCSITDLDAILQRNNVKLDLSRAIRTDTMFKGSKITCLPELDVSNVGSGAIKHIGDMFYQCADLHTIRKLIISNVYEVTTGKSTFSGCTSLANIEFGGTIWTDINMSVCPLTVESMISIITHLKNYAGTEKAGVYTLTLKDSCKALMAQQGAIAELDTKTYDAYIADIGWNLA